MNKNAIKFTLALICVVHATSMNGMQKQVIMSLPINATLPEGKRSHLIVEIPENFKPLTDITSSFVTFVPSNEDVKNLSKVITTHILLNQRVAAEQVIAQFKTEIEKKDPQAEIIAESSNKGEGYESKILLIAYLLQEKGKLLLASYFSGPCDCSGFQYTVAITNSVDKNAARAELEKFEKEKIKVINF